MIVQVVKKELPPPERERLHLRIVDPESDMVLESEHATKGSDGRVYLGVVTLRQPDPERKGCNLWHLCLSDYTVPTVFLPEVASFVAAGIADFRAYVEARG